MLCKKSRTSSYKALSEIVLYFLWVLTLQQLKNYYKRNTINVTLIALD